MPRIHCGADDTTFKPRYGYLAWHESCTTYSVTEPVYEYIKGKGWVVQTIETATFLTPKGKVRRIERRAPRKGEWWVDGSPNWEMLDFIEHCSIYEWEKVAHYPECGKGTNVVTVVIP